MNEQPRNEELIREISPECYLDMEIDKEIYIYLTGSKVEEKPDDLSELSPLFIRG